MAKGSGNSRSLGTNGGKSIAGGPTEEQWKDVEGYVAGDEMWVNRYWRGEWVPKGPLTESEKRVLKNIESATNGVLQKDMTLHRSVDASAIFGKMSDSGYYDLVDSVLSGEKNYMSRRVESAVGKTLQENGVMSTSRSKEVAQDWGDFSGSSKPVVLHLDVPKGTRGLDVRRFDVKDDPQREVILGRNMRYKINKVYGKDGYIHVDAKILK